MNESRIAKIKSRVDVVKSLLESQELWGLQQYLRGVGVNSVLNQEGLTPLMIAAQGASLEPIKMMVAQGARIDQALLERGERGEGLEGRAREVALVDGLVDARAVGVLVELAGQRRGDARGHQVRVDAGL